MFALFLTFMKEVTRRLTLTMPNKDETMRLLWNDPGIKVGDIPVRDGYLLLLAYSVASVRAISAEEKARERSQEVVWSADEPCEKFLPRSDTVAPGEPHGYFLRREDYDDLTAKGVATHLEEIRKLRVRVNYFQNSLPGNIFSRFLVCQECGVCNLKQYDTFSKNRGGKTMGDRKILEELALFSVL
jgi:hypothetical protein